MTSHKHFIRSQLSRIVRSLAIPLVGFCLVLMGCATQSPQFTEKEALNVNQAVGDSENELMMRNIVRAERREPLVYTNYESFTEAVPSGSLSLSTTGFTVQESNGSQFKSDVLDHDQQYLASVTTPLTSATFKYYYDQGWSTALLLHLLLGEIRVHPAQGQTVTYSNYPFDMQSYLAFDRIANELGGCHFALTQSKVPVSSGATPLPRFTLAGNRDGSGSADVARNACEDALKELGNSLDLCDPNIAEEERNDCIDLFFHSPAQVVTYLGDISREQWVGDLDDDIDSPVVLGVVSYSDACFYKMEPSDAEKNDGRPNRGPETCIARCNALFVLKDAAGEPSDDKISKAYCAWPDKPKEVQPLYTKDDTSPAKDKAESLKPLTVEQDGETYALPLAYLHHSETLHTLEIGELLMGYEIGVKSTSSNLPASVAPKSAGSDTKTK